MTGEVSETQTSGSMRYETDGAWQSGVLAGLVGGAVMGVIMTLLSPSTIEVAIPALVGLSGGLAGWVVHMSISAVFGVAFAALMVRTSLRRYADSVTGSTAAGLAYAVVLWLVAAGIVMPVWLDAVGFAAAPPVPNLGTINLVSHLGYGLFLGAAFPVLARTFQPEVRSPILG